MHPVAEKIRSLATPKSRERMENLGGLVNNRPTKWHGCKNNRTGRKAIVPRRLFRYRSVLSSPSVEQSTFPRVVLSSRPTWPYSRRCWRTLLSAGEVHDTVRLSKVELNSSMALGSWNARAVVVAASDHASVAAASSLNAETLICIQQHIRRLRWFVSIQGRKSWGLGVLTPWKYVGWNVLTIP